MSVYLVTGAAGFIGSHICEELLKNKSSTVIGVDNFYTGNQSNIDFLSSISEKFHFFETDIRDHDALCEIIKEFGVQCIFHQAAIASVQTSIEKPLFTHDVNVKGSLSILEAARKYSVKKIIFASSAAVYGDDPTLPKNEKVPTQPISPYGLEKLIVEQYLKLYSQQYNLECIALRYFNIYGPRQDPKSEYSGVISIFKNRLQNGDLITIYGDGEQYRDFVYVKDVARINLLVAAKDNSANGYSLFCVGTGIKTSLNKLVSVIENACSINNISVQFASPRIGDIRESVCENIFLMNNIESFIFSNIEEKIDF